MAIEKTIVLKVDSDQANKSLNQTEQELNDVAKASGKAAEEIKKTNKSLNEILMSTDDVNKKLKDLDQTVATSPKNFRDLNKQIQAYQTIALQAGRESAVGKEALSKAAALKDQMVDLQNETKRLSDDNKNLQGAIGIGTGVLAGFTAYQGALGMIGVESKDLQKTMVKLQAAQSALNGIVQLQTAFQKESAAMLLINTLRTKAATAANVVFNAVMKANPIGLIITAITALIAGITALIMNFEAITNWLGITDDAAETLHQENLRRTEEFIEQQGKRIDAISKERDEIEGIRKFEVEMMKARGDSEENIFKAVRKNRLERIKSNNEFQVQVKQQNDALISQFKLLQQSGDLTDEQAKEINAQIEKNNETIRAAKTESKTLLQEIKLDDVTTTREAEDEKAKIRKEAFEKRKAQIIAEMDEEARLRRDADNFLKEYEERKALEKELKDKELLEDIERERALTDEIQASLDAELAVEEAKVDAAIEADNKKKELAEAELQRERELQSAKLELAGATLQGIGNLVNAFAGENEEQQKRAFNISKAISIAQATIDTYKGATAAFASTAASPLGIANPAAPFIAAAAAVAAGLANVATIARQQYGGGGSGGTGGGAGASNPPAGLSNPATFNVVGNTGANQLAQTLGQQPLQAYVVAGDVTSAQSLERNKIQQSTL
jgi:hypothetical protein